LRSASCGSHNHFIKLARCAAATGARRDRTVQSASTDNHSESALLVIEDSLEAVRTVARLLDHMCGSIKSGREIGEEELASLQQMLEAAHDDIDVHWKMALEERRHVQKQHDEVLATITASLADERAKHGAPGSVVDIEHAQFCWRMVRGAAEIALGECDKSDPHGRSPGKTKRRGRAKQ
jgi:hypothetical protein